MRKLILYFILFFQILLIISLVKGVYGSFQARERIAKLQETKSQLENKKKEQEKKLEEVQSPMYLEKVARDELHLSKPGETVVIIPESQRIGESANQRTQEEGEKANWMKWWEVVSGKI